MKRTLLLLLALLTWTALPARLPAGADAGSRIGGRCSPDGRETLRCDLPPREHLHNAVGIDGLGLCVFTSLEMSARYQHAEGLRGLQQWMARTHKGGGCPTKVDAVLREYAPDARWVQYAGDDPTFLGLALRAGRMPAVTYGYSPRYGRPVAHMVNLAHLSEHWAAVLDNNYPGPDSYEWMPPREFLARWRLGGGGWAVALLDPPAGPRPPALWTWYAGPGEPARRYLFRDGAEAGCWDGAGGYYRPYDGGRDIWGPKTLPPVGPPDTPALGGTPAGCPNFGLDRCPGEPDAPAGPAGHEPAHPAAPDVAGVPGWAWAAGGLALLLGWALACLGLVLCFRPAAAHTAVPVHLYVSAGLGRRPRRRPRPPLPPGAVAGRVGPPPPAPPGAA